MVADREFNVSSYWFSPSFYEYAGTLLLRYHCLKNLWLRSLYTHLFSSGDWWRANKFCFFHECLSWGLRCNFWFIWCVIILWRYSQENILPNNGTRNHHDCCLKHYFWVYSIPNRYWCTFRRLNSRVLSLMDFPSSTSSKCTVTIHCSSFIWLHNCRFNLIRNPVNRR